MPERTPILLAPAEVTRIDRADGSMLLRSPQPLHSYGRNLGEFLRHWALHRPEQVFLAERSAVGWREVRYVEALRAAQRIAQSLLGRDLGLDRPVLVLSGNSVDHALLMLGCFLAGVPIAPVSPAYSLMTSDYGKVHRIVELVRPGLIYVDRFEPFASVLWELRSAQVEIVTSDPDEGPRGVVAFDELQAKRPGPALQRAEALVGPDTIAKYLFTSGSTGTPKGVINTHRMLCANQQMIEQCWPFVRDTPPVLVDWLPWNHTFGGNHNFNLVLAQGGTLYIDEGKPRADLVQVTVGNLQEVSPTIYCNVPAGYAMLLPLLEGDANLRKRFFQQLQMIFYAGSALSQDLWERLEAVAIEATGEPVMLASAWGSTETAPMATTVHFPISRAGIIGLPAPGVDLKLLPSGSKLEMRVRGPNVTPGYLRDPERTEAAFDEEGFYKIGDAGLLVDPDDPSCGLMFDGRVAEDFKLTSGTWVHVGTLRVAALAAAAPALHDAVVCGHDRDSVGLLAWLDLAGSRRLCSHDGAHPDLRRLATCPDVREHVRRALRRYNDDQTGSSTKIARVLLVTEPPSIDDDEITDKGYINQRAVLEKRGEAVERLYDDPPAQDVLLVTSP